MTKIPKKIKQGGHIIKIDMTKDIAKCNACGQWDCHTNTISLDSTLPDTQLGATFIHELIHAMNIIIPESDVEFLSQGLYQILHDNDIDFRSKNDKRDK